MPDCPFCYIATQGLPPHGVYEDERSFVMLDRESLGFGHCLVIPKRHAAKVYELDANEYHALFGLAQRLAIQLEGVLRTQAVGYVAFGSGVPHAHLHLIPHTDARVLLYPREYVTHRSDAEVRVDAARLRSLLPAEW